MKLRDAIEEDIPEIVDIHVQAFDGFFLTSLGKPFLVELYKAFYTRNDGILRVLCDCDGSIIGFAGGAIRPDFFYKDLRKKRGFVFLIKMIPALFKMPILAFKKLWYAVFYKGDKPASLTDSVLLSSIAIKPELKGNSFGKMLLDDYESVVGTRGFKSIYLTTDKYNNDGVVSFYNSCGYIVESEFYQADRRNMLRLIKLIDGAKNGL